VSSEIQNSSKFGLFGLYRLVLIVVLKLGVSVSKIPVWNGSQKAREFRYKIMKVSKKSDAVMGEMWVSHGGDRYIRKEEGVIVILWMCAGRRAPGKVSPEPKPGNCVSV